MPHFEALCYLTFAVWSSRSPTDAEILSRGLLSNWHRGGHHMPAATETPDVIQPACVAGSEKVFGLSESQIARRVKAIARATGLADWGFLSGHSGRAWPGAWPRTAPPPTGSSARAVGSRAAAWSAATPAASPPDQRSDTCRASPPWPNTAWRSVSFSQVCQPRPPLRKYSTTSESSRIWTFSLVGDFCLPRVRR